jgi:hypothetical protein
VKEHPDLPRAERPRKDPPLEPSEEAWFCEHFDIRALASRTVRQNTSIPINNTISQKRQDKIEN